MRLLKLCRFIDSQLKSPWSYHNKNALCSCAQTLKYYHGSVWFMFTVIGTETYLEELKRWQKSQQEAAERIPEKLRENPLSGKPLGFPFLREKRIGEKRVYYLVYEDLGLVLLVAASGKKDHQYTIDRIKEQLKEYRMVAEEVVKAVCKKSTILWVQCLIRSRLGLGL